MILFSGHGDIANCFAVKYQCEVISLRHQSITELEILLKGYNVIIHNAANLRPLNLEESSNDNFILTKKIVDTICRINPEVKFIYLSSMSILGDEHEYLNPLHMTQYAFSKYLGELYTLASPLQNAIVVRFSTIFYEDYAKDGLSNLIYNAATTGKVNIINDGIAKRDFIPIEILTDYLYKLSSSYSNRKIYNICSGQATSFRDVLELLKLRIENLLVENQHVDSMIDVLSTFSTEGLKELGLANFELSNYINRYLDKFMNV